MNKAFNFLASPVLMVICLSFFAISMAVATFIEAIHGTDVARQFIYNVTWFELLIFIGATNLLLSIFSRKLYKKEKLTVFVFHIAMVVIILGAAITRYTSYEGTMYIREGKTSNSLVRLDKSIHQLPFSVYLNDFVIEYYPGSKNPSGFESRVTLIDTVKNISREQRIYMNNILKHRGYRFYQNSYTEDQKTTILTVSKDALGTGVSYAGYSLLALGMILSLFNRNSRFSSLIRNKTAMSVILIVSSLFSLNAQESDSVPVIPLSHTNNFGNILVRDYQGRTKPISTLVSDMLRKISKKDEFKGQNASQVFLGAMAFPDKWDDVKLIYAGTNIKESLGLTDKYASLIECYKGGGTFISTRDAHIAYQKPPGNRTKTENSLIKFDERLNITYHWFMGNMLNIFPDKTSENEEWLNPASIRGKVKTADSIFVEGVISLYLSEVQKSVETGDWTTPDEIVSGIIKYQRTMGTNLPSESKVKLEQWYYKSGVFKRSAYLYLLFGLLLLIIQMLAVFRNKPAPYFLTMILSGGLIGVLLMHSAGLAIRWYISGHAPWSNSYETMIFISWSSVIAGSIFIKRNTLAFSISAIMAAIFLVVANMSWMDPQITNLVPVLRSVWLVIHVAVITSSYGFLGIGALMALSNLLAMSVQTAKNKQFSNEMINNLTRIIEITLTIGLYLLTIGTFLGAVWANVSWGRYWAWDPKETWALITVIIYAIVLHFRIVPKFKSRLLFNISALIAYASVLMTYFGVNFYLAGLHSYAQGDPAPIPKGVYYSLGMIILLCLIAIFNQRRLKVAK